MDAGTAEELSSLTRGFYDRSAGGFSAASDLPWPGWEESLDRLSPHLSPLPALSVLDVGCGNGRLVRLLHQRLGRAFTYLGIDASAPLVALARSRHGEIPGCRFEVRDLLAAPFDQVLPPGPFGLVTLFGVLHHIPGFTRRRALLGALARRLGAGGCLAISTWRMLPPQQLRRRVVPWESLARGGAHGPDPAVLEAGDYLIEKAGHGARYCHFIGPEEGERLLAGPPLSLISSFTADGRGGGLNRYFLLRNGAEPAAGRG